MVVERQKKLLRMAYAEKKPYNYGAKCLLVKLPISSFI
jgi:hypothetical protein